MKLSSFTSETRSNCMSQSSKDSPSFQSVLMDKLKAQSAEEGVLNTTFVFSPSPSNNHIGEKLSLLGLSRFRISSDKKYPRAKNVATPPPPPKWKPEGLPQPIVLAFEFFHTHGEVTLTDTVTDKDLKSAFRRLAKRLHPDQHMQAQTLYNNLFRDLQAHYERLSLFLHGAPRKVA